MNFFLLPEMFTKTDGVSTIQLMKLNTTERSTYHSYNNDTYNDEFLYESCGSMIVLSHQLYVGVGVALTFSCFAVAANIIVLVILRSKGNRRTVFDLTIASLACTDLLASASFLIFFSLLVMCKIIKKAFVSLNFFDKCLLFSVIVSTYFFLLSVFHVLLISFQRFFALFFPFKCRQYFTKSLTKILIAVMWTISLAAVPFLLYIEKTFSALAIVIFAVGGLLLCMYFMLAFKMCQMLKTNRSELRREYRALLNALGVTVSFFACFSPAGYALMDEFSSVLFFFSFASINFLFDPLLYFYMSFWLQRRDERRAASAVHSANTTQSTDTHF